MKHAVLLVGGALLAATAQAAGLTVSEEHVRTLPEDIEKKLFVREMLAMTGLHNDVRVVIDPKAKGYCAYATTVNGRQVIGIDPDCVLRVRSALGYDWHAVGVLAHEIGHLLGGHTVNAKNGHREESEADEWAGWAMKRLGATLDQAQTFARNMQFEQSPTHPARQVRIASVERGWRRAATEALPSQMPRTTENWWLAIMQKPVSWPSAMPADQNSTNAPGLSERFASFRESLLRQLPSSR